MQLTKLSLFLVLATFTFSNVAFSNMEESEPSTMEKVEEPSEESVESETTIDDSEDIFVDGEESSDN